MASRLSAGLKRLAVLVLVSTLASGAAAEVPASATTQLNTAYAALDGLIRRARPNGTLPRWSEPDSAKVLAQLWDTAAILGRPPYTSKDVTVLLAILQKQIQVLRTYSLFPPGPGVAPDTVRNTAVFQDEITRAQIFLIKTISAAIPAMNDSVGQLGTLGMTDMRRQGLRRTRLGLQELVTGAVQTLRNPSLRPANQTLLAESLRDNAAVLAGATPQGDRPALRAAIQLALPSLGAAALAPMQSVVAVLSGAPCDRLCALE